MPSSLPEIRAYIAAQAVRLLLKKGVLGSGVFQVDDCRRTYEELKKKGVQFAGAPEDRLYGIEAIMKDGPATGSA